MNTGELDTKVDIRKLVISQAPTGLENTYLFDRSEFCKVEYLETVKDNAAETPDSHDSAYAIARLMFRRWDNTASGQSKLVHLSTHRYVINGQVFEAVGMPIYKDRFIVYVNVKVRNDLTGVSVI